MCIEDYLDIVREEIAKRKTNNRNNKINNLLNDSI